MITYMFLQSILELSQIQSSLGNSEVLYCYCLLAQHLLQFSRNGISNLCGGCLSSDIARGNTRLDDVADSGFDGLGFCGTVDGVLEQHGCGKDGGDGVDDAFSGDVGSGAYGWIFCQLLNFYSGDGGGGRIKGGGTYRGLARRYHSH